MKVNDQQRSIMDRINHQFMLKSVKKDDHKHDIKRARSIENEVVTRANRATALLKHEDNNHVNMQARIKEVDAHQYFLRESLKII